MSNQAEYDGRIIAWFWSMRCDRADCSAAVFVTVGAASAAGVASLVSPMSSSSPPSSAFSGAGASGASSGLSDTGAASASVGCCLMVASSVSSTIDVS